MLKARTHRYRCLTACLIVLTLSVGAVLVALAGRRLWHRFRGQPDPADLDRPDPLDVALSHTDDDEPSPRTRGAENSPVHSGEEREK